MRGWIIVLCLAAAACVALAVVYVSCPQAGPSVTPSPSYWHWLDTVDPREDTAIYMTREEQQPRRETRED